MCKFYFCDSKSGCIFAMKGSDVRPPHLPDKRLRPFNIIKNAEKDLLS